MKKRKTSFYMSHRLLYTLIALGILLITGVGVYATTYTASGAGHPYTEISTCAANQTLKMNSAGTAWTCAAGSTGTTPLYNPNSYCASGLTTSSTCSTIVCSTQTYCTSYGNSCPGYPQQCLYCTGYGYINTFYTCSGSCSASSTQACSNTLLGYLVS